MTSRTLGLVSKLQDFEDFRRHLCFESDTMQVLSLSSRHRDPKLPLTRGRINFTVMRSDGKVSNRWGVKVERAGDAYVFCRDNPNMEKVSLHASGRQHIAFPRESEAIEKIGPKNRFRPVWTQPTFQSEAIATFTLMFPPWGVGLDLSDLVNRRKAKNDELLIVGHNEKLLVVGFFILESGRNMRGRMPHIVLGELPLTEQKVLHVIAWKEPQKDLVDKIQNTFPHVAQTSLELGLHEGDYTMHAQGFRAPNSAFMVVVPIHYTPPEDS